VPRLREGSSVGAVGLCADDKAAGEVAWQVPDPSHEVALSPGRVWTLIGADAAEIDTDGRVIRRLSLPGARCLGCDPRAPGRHFSPGRSERSVR